MHTLPKPPGVATMRVQSENPPAFVPAETRSERSALQCWQLTHLCAATSGRSRKCSYDQWQADRLQMCTCQINKCYKVNNAFIWINFTVSVWENSGKTIHHHKCFSWIILSTDVIGSAWLLLSVTRCLLYLNDRNIYTNMHTNSQSPTHTPSAFKQNQNQELCVAAAEWLEWQAKTFCTMANILIHSYVGFL